MPNNERNRTIITKIYHSGPVLIIGQSLCCGFALWTSDWKAATMLTASLGSSLIQYRVLLMPRHPSSFAAAPPPAMMPSLPRSFGSQVPPSRPPSSLLPRPPSCLAVTHLCSLSKHKKSNCLARSHCKTTHISISLCAHIRVDRLHWNALPRLLVCAT